MKTTILYAILLRKLEIDGEIYYQGVKKITGCINDNNELKIDGEDLAVPLVATEDDISTYSYYEADADLLSGVPDNLLDTNFFLKIEDGELSEIDSMFETEKVKLAFYNVFHDFNIIPDYDINSIIVNAKKNMKEKIIGQDNVIDNILSKIYHNQLFMSSDITNEDVLKYKTNALIMGPHGTGKSLIKEQLLKELDPIPVIEYELTGDVQDDVNNILKLLIRAANGNISLAKRGIVIFDSMKENSDYISDTGENLYLKELKQVLNQKKLRSAETGEVLFDCSMLTYILMLDIDYEHEEKEDAKPYYSRISMGELMEFGLDIYLLYDVFNEEIIYMNEMNYDLAKKILKDSNISPLIKIKKALEKTGKKVYFESKFVDKLINQGLDLDEGFQGILRLLNYVTQRKNIENKEIRFTLNDLDKLKVGTASVEDEFEDEKMEKNNSLNEVLDINVEKRTINGLTVSDAVKKVTKKIKGQDEQVFRIVNSLYKQIMDQNKDFDTEQLKDLKASVLLMGGTGVGKTAILEKIATIFNIPFIRADSTKYSGTGIMGGDVEDILKDLVTKAKGDRKLAERGIVYIDEIDKLALNKGSNVNIGGDVQRSFLTLVEGAKVPIKPGFTETFESYEFDTTNVIFFAGGAFDGIDQIVKKRVLKEKGGKIGFTNDKLPEINESVTTDDISEYGLDRQLAGRFPKVVSLNNLDENILLEIINSDEGFVNLNRDSYRFEGVKLTLSPEFRKSLARKAFLDKKGARSIKTIFSQLLDQIDMDRINGDIEEVILDEQSLDNPKQITYVKKKK